MKSLFVLIACFVLSYSIVSGQAKTSVDKEVFKVTDKITFSFSSPTPMPTNSWIGLFKASVKHNSNKGYVTYQYVQGSKGGRYEFENINEPGEYEIRLFNGDPGEELSYAGFKVIPVDPREIQLTVLTDRILPGKAFKVKLESDIEFVSQSWLGIFPKGLSRDTYKGYLSYTYFGGTRDGIFHMTAPLEWGEYELRFYSSDYGILLKAVPFFVGELDLDGISFKLNKDAFDPEEKIEIEYVGHKDLTKRSWFGIFKKGAEEINDNLKYRYLNPILGGISSFKAPAEKGEYIVKLFYSDLGPELLSPIPFEVTSSLDKTYLEDKIEEDGKVVLYGIYFDTNKSSVKSESYALISQIANMLLEEPSMKIRVEGHTDSQGTSEYNLDLSTKRSAAIIDILTSEYRVPSSQLESVGRGESVPVGDNETESGRALNRRVELVKI